MNTLTVTYLLLMDSLILMIYMEIIDTYRDSINMLD